MTQVSALVVQEGYWIDDGYQSDTTEPWPSEPEPQGSSNNSPPVLGTSYFCPQVNCCNPLDVIQWRLLRFGKQVACLIAMHGWHSQDWPFPVMLAEDIPSTPVQTFFSIPMLCSYSTDFHIICVNIMWNEQNSLICKQTVLISKSNKWAISSDWMLTFCKALRDVFLSLFVKTSKVGGDKVALTNTQQLG